METKILEIFSSYFSLQMITFTFNDLFCKLWMWVLFWKADYTQKRESGFCFKNATLFQIQDKFEDRKPNINVKRTSFIILISENSLKLGIVVLVIINKMLVIVLIIDFYSRYGPGFYKPKSTLSVRNGSSVSFGTEVHWNHYCI